MFDTSRWWDAKRLNMDQFIKTQPSPEDAVRFAQTDSNCSFDHRQPYNKVIVSFKRDKLMKRFGCLPDIKESEFSIPGSVKNGYSNIFLTHLYFYLRIMEQGTPQSILEIGGGYGGLARIFKTLNPLIEYTIVDLPESLYFSSAFLSLNGIEDVRFISTGDTEALTLRGKNFDLTINTFGFQEMPPETIVAYVDFIQTAMKVRDFYTCNYYNNNHTGIEQSYDGLLPVDDGWNVIFEELNFPILIADSPKNFRELYLRRRADA